MAPLATAPVPLDPRRRAAATPFAATLLAITAGAADLAAQQWRSVLPPPRSGATSVYDVRRARTVLFGGYDIAGSFDDTWEYDGNAWRRVATPVSPPAQSGHAMAYDWARARTVLFGGFASGLADTWEFDGTNWTRVQTASAPPVRGYHAMAYDLARGRTVLFGGGDLTSQFSDTWEFDGANWIAVATATAPAARQSHAMAFDVARGRTVLFGGADRQGTLFRDSWEYDGVHWRPVATATAPPGRADHGLAYDLLRSRTVLFGGNGIGIGGSGLNDTWEYDGVNWFPVQTALAPPAQGARAFACDLLRRRCVLLCSDTSQSIAQTWEYDGTSWMETTVSPPVRSEHALAHDAARSRTVLFGGMANFGAALLDDTWEFDGVGWRRVAAATSPPARLRHALAYEATRGRTLLFGGSTGGFVNALADTWAFDGATWRPVATATSPPPRQQHALAHDAARRRTVLFGGKDSGGTVLGDTWEFDGADWTQAPASPSPPARARHAMAYEPARGRTLLFGGEHPAGPLGDTWDWDGSTWRPVATATPPPAQAGAALASDPLRGRAILFSGRVTGSAVRAETWEYDGTDWRRFTTSTAPFERNGPALAFDLARGRMVLFAGGFTGGVGLADTWELLPPAAASWTRYGRGCAGSAGTPVLDAAPGASPALGSTFTLQLSLLPASPGLVLLALGTDLARWNGALLPADLGPLGLPGCQLWIAPAPGASVLVAHGGATAGFALAIPAAPVLAGLVVATQAFVFDAAAPSGLGAVTNSGIMRLY